MKTLKFILIAGFIALTSLSYAQNFNGKTLPMFENKTLSISLTLKQAVAIPHLAEEIYFQVNPGFLGFETDSLYTFKIRMKGVTYIVTGTFGEWKKFFRIDRTKKNDGNRIEE